MRLRNKEIIVYSVLVAWIFINLYILFLNNCNLFSGEMKAQNRLRKVEKDTFSEYGNRHELTKSVLDRVFKDKFIATTVEPNLRDIDVVALSNKQLPKLQGTYFKLKGDVNAMEAPTPTRLPNGQPVIPILVLACNRTSVSKCLENLIQYRPSVEQFPIIVSQDCQHEPTKNVILSYKSQVTFIEQPDQSEPPEEVEAIEEEEKGYYKIARHYGWALNKTFQRDYEFVVIVEDDLNVAPDFYEYFLGTYHLLKQDKSIWCVSAWNDNGKVNFIDPAHPELLYRTDYFPNLGWMLTRELWQELSVKWPKLFWDEWMREPEQRKDRVCIRPEISRTQLFSIIGVSGADFFNKYLKHVKLYENFVPFTKLNLSYLLKENYDDKFLKSVYSLPIVTYHELRQNLISKDGPVQIQYTTKKQHKRITQMVGLMTVFKYVPRTAYHGIISFFYRRRRIFLVPTVNWKGYLSWT